jgi:lysozyme
MESSIKELIIRHEGVKLKPYICTSGKLTIGVGRNLDDNGITESEAMMMLDNDIAEFTKQLSTLSFYGKLDEVRKAAIIDMCFNLGFPRFAKFKKMIAALEVGGYEEASNQALDSIWAVQVGDRAKEISEIIRTGKFNA